MVYCTAAQDVTRYLWQLQPDNTIIMVMALCSVQDHWTALGTQLRCRIAIQMRQHSVMAWWQDEPLSQDRICFLGNHWPIQDWPCAHCHWCKVFETMIITAVLDLGYPTPFPSELCPDVWVLVLHLSELIISPIQGINFLYTVRTGQDYTHQG